MLHANDENVQKNILILTQMLSYKIKHAANVTKMFVCLWVVFIYI